jgi:hypothetical protein
MARGLKLTDWAGVRSERGAVAGGGLSTPITRTVMEPV